MLSKLLNVKTQILNTIKFYNQLANEKFAKKTDIAQINQKIIDMEPDYLVTYYNDSLDNVIESEFSTYQSLSKKDGTKFYPITQTGAIIHNSECLQDVIGDVDISTLGDGTIKGAISSISNMINELKTRKTYTFIKTGSDFSNASVVCEKRSGIISIRITMSNAIPFTAWTTYTIGKIVDWDGGQREDVVTTTTTKTAIPAALKIEEDGTVKVITRSGAIDDICYMGANIVIITSI